MKIAFDVIGDLHVEDGDSFTWENRATSLYCIVCGNISDNTGTIYAVLKKLSKCYLGVFYIGGVTELGDVYKLRGRHAELARICKILHNVAYLQNHVVVVDSVAIVGAVGWHSLNDSSAMTEILSDKLRQQDYEYLKGTIERLQLHMDVRRIVIVTPCVPDSRLFFGRVPETIDEHAPLTVVLQYDTERKITHWVYGSGAGHGTLQLDNIIYMNNSSDGRSVYNPQRIEV